MHNINRRSFLRSVFSSLVVFSISDLIKPRLLYAQTPSSESIHDFQKVILAQTNFLNNKNGVSMLLSDTQDLNSDNIKILKDLLKVTIAISNEKNQKRLIEDVNTQVENLNTEALNLTTAIMNRFEATKFEECIELSYHFFELEKNQNANNIIILFCLIIIAGMSLKSSILLKNNNEQKQDIINKCLQYIQSMQSPEKEKSTYSIFKKKNEQIVIFKKNPEGIPRQLKEVFEYSLSSSINNALKTEKEVKQNTKITELLINIKPNAKVTIENIFSLRFTEIRMKCVRMRIGSKWDPEPQCEKELINQPDMQQNLSIIISKESDETFPKSFAASYQWITSKERHPRIIYQEKEKYKESESVLMIGNNFTETMKLENKTEKIIENTRGGIAFLKSTPNAKKWEVETKQLNENVLFKILSDEQDIWLYYHALINIKRLENHIRSTLS